MAAVSEETQLTALVCGVFVAVFTAGAVAAVGVAAVTVGITRGIEKAVARRRGAAPRLRPLDLAD